MEWIGFIAVLVVGLYILIGVTMALYAMALLTNTGMSATLVSIAVGSFIIWLAFRFAPFTLTFSVS